MTELAVGEPVPNPLDSGGGCAKPPPLRSPAAVPLARELSSEDSNMPKMKSKRAASKRFKATGGGRIRRSTAGKQHLMRGKSANRMRKLKKNSMVAPVDEARIPRLLPYEL